MSSGHYVIMWLSICNGGILCWNWFCFNVSCIILICITRASFIAWGLRNAFHSTIEGNCRRHPVLRVSLKEAADLGSSIICSKCRSGMRVKIYLQLLCSVELCLQEENVCFAPLVSRTTGYCCSFGIWTKCQHIYFKVGLAFDFKAPRDWC